LIAHITVYFRKSAKYPIFKTSFIEKFTYFKDGRMLPARRTPHLGKLASKPWQVALYTHSTPSLYHLRYVLSHLFYTISIFTKIVIFGFEEKK
jgi:hypothetical protein